MAFTFYLMKLPWLAGDEKFLIWSTSAAKFSFRELPDSENFAFINTSYDLSLIDRYDEFGFPIGNQPITDREKLALLLHSINAGESKPKYIIIDIHFVDSTAYDSTLYAELQKLDNVILSSHINEEGVFEAPIFRGINYGLSDYVIGSVFDGVYKYQLVHGDSLKLLPLKVHEAITGAESQQMGPFVKIDNRWTTNNFIMNYRVLQKDILNMEAGFNPVSMGELLFLTDEDIQDFVADKIVVIGDFFENDMHETIFEITAGPLILVNAYLTIKNHDTTINLLFFLLMICFYTYLSYMVFYEGDMIENWIRKISGKSVSRYFMGFASYFFILVLFSILCFALFNVHINIFFVAVGYYMLDRIMNLIFSRKKSNQNQVSSTS